MKTKLALFSAYGVELEYMIVNRDDLAVFPISDRLIFDVTGEFQNEVAFDQIAWSNELVLHVIELKTNGPASSLTPLANYFQNEIQHVNSLLEKYNAKLLPTGAHPWMDPFSEAKLWPHDNNIIYETYDKIFDCRGHGWSNLQSVHLNLPFADDAEFSKLHTAIRVLLPIVPALSASTPIIDKKLTGLLDTRLEYYRLNQQRMPSVTGLVIPELVHSEKEYCERILNPMYQEIASYDPKKILQEEWLNSRGAIARFERNTIEIRVVDTQECPQADLAILQLIVATLQALICEKWQPFVEQIKWSEENLHKIFLDSIKTGLKTPLDNADYAGLFGGKGCATVGDLWQHILTQLSGQFNGSETVKIINTILQHGNLAQRIVNSLDHEVTTQKLKVIYQKLADCLQRGRLFLPCGQ